MASPKRKAPGAHGPSQRMRCQMSTVVIDPKTSSHRLEHVALLCPRNRSKPWHTLQGFSGHRHRIRIAIIYLGKLRNVLP